ncbi:MULTISPECIES: T6SS immunity protein Tli3 family protein [unclassified Variovorax]|uniref:T6SS immunity protein Tli3 family protein n=1 Tax=unclassified Variovorax TaxID=663243 RepID=UPI003F466E12
MSKIDFRPVWRLTLVALVMGLGACAQSGSRPKVLPAASSKPPQVVYRIDDHRHFELTPDETCFGNMLYFVDTAKGIRSEVVTFDAVMNRTTLIIDAANDQYLVAPVTRGSINCSSGGGGCGGDKMPYSTDGGRTWQRVQASTSHDTMISGSMAYQATEFIGYSAPGFDKKNIIREVVFDGIDLAKDITTTGGVNGPRRTEGYWKRVEKFTFKPRIAPVDTKVQCKAQDSGSSK